MDIEKLKLEAQSKALHIADVSGSALFNADCMDILPLIPDESVDLILTDPPYTADQNPLSHAKPLRDERSERCQHLMQPKRQSKYIVLLGCRCIAANANIPVRV